eukprot:TRINITY_DN34081_c0_g1_i1.p1 TRINITY_DN34081_c0_g1~~TRINITY_DN34081_c0_g1_i1.p1  ORF type:complete len:464 (-),score=75.56 TRINITY_DN34081_c0_g1_i1:105-1496(-)
MVSGTKPSCKPQQERERISGARHLGRLVEWRETHGWIQPIQAIHHPAAKRHHKGKVFVGQEDVEEELLGVGSCVTFIPYVSEAGLGAMHVRPSHDAFVPRAELPLPQDQPVTFPQIRVPYPKAQIQPPPQQIPQLQPLQLQKRHSETQPKTQVQQLHPLKSQKRRQEPAAKPQVDRPPKRTRRGHRGAAALVRRQGLGRDDPNKPLAARDLASREPVSSCPGTGVVVRTVGKAYFIKADERIDHPNDKHQGLLYLHPDDVDGEAPLLGAKVIFNVYSGPRGLGAEHCIVVEQGDVPEQPTEPQESYEETFQDSYAEVFADAPARPSAVPPDSDPDEEGCGMSNYEDGDSEDGSLSSDPEGRIRHRQRRSTRAAGAPQEESDKRVERLSTELVLGEVTKWCDGRFGWIKPLVAVDHPIAKKNGGKVYIHVKDVKDPGDMDAGKTVTFHLVARSNGLHAEECSIF